MLYHHGIAADASQLRHRYGDAIGTVEMLRCAKDLKLKCRVIGSTWERLAKTPLPAIAERRDGSFIIVHKVGNSGAIILDPARGRPESLDRGRFESEWSGKLILMTRRASLIDTARRFDITWFLQAMVKYRQLLGEVFIASFFLQLFALVSPLFFQVVIDKVLVHRGLSTLDVIVIGLLVVSVFESVLTALRTYVFSHTTNRIDVELGSRLFRHLVGLPISYFEARRAGDSVARVRELENIRNFLTGSALTLVIDLFFTFVFLGVMAFYSLWLTGIVLLSFPFYIAISALATPVFRHRLNEKFNRGAENQAFLVETVTGIGTLKALAVEPQMQRRWEEQLASYVRSSFKVSNLGNTAGRIMRPLRHNGVPYSGINILMLWAEAVAQGFTTPVWMTFRQAAELDAHVRKGEKGSLVVYANSITRTEQDDKGDEAEREIHYMKGYTVFNVEQIDGLPEQYYARPEVTTTPVERISHAEAFFQATKADTATRLLISGESDETRPPVRGRNVVLGKRAAYVVRVTVPLGQIAKNAVLRSVVVADRERLHLLQRESAVAVGLEHRGAHARELQAFLHGGFGDSESRRDVGRRRAAIDQIPEGLELVCGMHGRAHDVLGEADFRRVGRCCHDVAGHRSVRSDLAFTGERGEHEMPALARDHGELALLGLLDDEGLQDAVRGNRGPKLLDAVRLAGLADVAVPRDEFVKRNGNDGLY
jgi:hypothetical protein